VEFEGRAGRFSIMRGLEPRAAHRRSARRLQVALGCVLALIVTGAGLLYRSYRFAVQVVQSSRWRSPSTRHASPAEVSSAFELRLVPAAAQGPARAALLAPSAVTAGVTAPQRSLWHRDGQCAAGSEPRAVLDRAQYLATFERVAVPDTTLFVEAGVTAEAVATVRENLTQARAVAEGRLGLDASPPLIYLYASVQSLRDHACVNSSSVAYYDGAIHLAMNTAEDHYLALKRSLGHEYVHHVLFRNGIEEPMWFQEGSALLFAGEHSWFKWHPTGRMLPSSAMVRDFPQTASPEFTEAFYGQSFRMVTFLNDLCWRRKGCSFARDLVAALKNGRATPDTLFDWAVSERGTDLFASTRLPLWDDYVENGFAFSVATEPARGRRFLVSR
jgi:hypothetical protein